MNAYEQFFRVLIPAVSGGRRRVTYDTLSHAGTLPL